MKLFKVTIKILLSGLAAVLILSGILAFYSLRPVHVANDGGGTDYVWPANTHWIEMEEGTAWGQYDAAGFNNPQVIEDPDILVLGSSHMEAEYVAQDRNVAAVLSQMLDGRYTVYNMGISGHTLYKVCQYLPESLTQDATPPKLAIIETSTVNLTAEEVAQVLNHTVEYTPSYNTGLVAQLQKLPFLRLLHKRMDDGLISLFMGNAIAPPSLITDEAPVDQQAFDDLFGYLREIQNEYGTRLLLVYHPTGQLEEDGRISFPEFPAHREAFAKTADAYGIGFIDLTAAFETMYDTQHHTPHGFVNGPVEAGHLNAYGHRCFAEQVYAQIDRMEKEGGLCR